MDDKKISCRTSSSYIMDSEQVLHVSWIEFVFYMASEEVLHFYQNWVWFHQDKFFIFYPNWVWFLSELSLFLHGIRTRFFISSRTSSSFLSELSSIFIRIEFDFIFVFQNKFFISISKHSSCCNLNERGNQVPLATHHLSHPALNVDSDWESKLIIWFGLRSDSAQDTQVIVSVEHNTND